MATVNLGRIKPVFRGAYNNSTAYVIDDIVTYQDETYIAITATTGNLPTVTANWTKLAAKGTDGTDLTSTLTTQGDIVYRNASGLARLGAGTNGQALITGGTGANPSWGTISSGNYSVHAFDKYSYNTDTGHNGQTHYVDIAGGNTVSFTPTHVDDVILFSHGAGVNMGSTQGADVYLNMGTSSTLSSSNTRLNYSGTHANYVNSISDYYTIVTKTFHKPCTGLTVGTTYYVEQAGAVHTNNQTVNFNSNGSGATGDQNEHWVNLIHFKKN